jgi:CBS domain containing-hemolysin-like protein
MSIVCLTVALLLTTLLCFVSIVQLFYHESMRLLRRERPSLEFFRETLMEKIGLEPEKGSLAFSLIKHLSLALTGTMFLCVLLQAQMPAWQSVLEAMVVSLAAMLFSTYFIPFFVYFRTDGKWLLKVVPVIRLLAACAAPPAAAVHLINSLLDTEKTTNGHPAPTDTVEHVEALIDAGAEEGILEESDRKLIHSVVAFGDKSVREVMTPRPAIIAISFDKTIEDLRQLVIHEGFSRIPVFEDNIDHLLGFVHVRDIFELDEADRQSKTLVELMRSLTMVPEMKPVSELLRQMQSEGLHMVAVVDEYGNTAGIATMEDLVEEILGEIHDEHETERDVRQEADHVYIAPGHLDLDRLHDLLNFRPEEDTESTTVGGLAAEWLGHVPQVGETAERGGIRVEVLAGNERRVEQVRISRVEDAAPVTAGVN